MEEIIRKLRSSVTDLSLATKLHNDIKNLPSPSLAASRLRLPCILFPLEDVHSSESENTETSLYVYRATTPAFGDVEIKTEVELTNTKGLSLVHPWIRLVLHQESFSHGAGSLDQTTQALRFIARLRQSFGALLFQSLSHVEYRRVAADSLIMTRIYEEVSLTELINGIRTIEVR